VKALLGGAKRVMLSLAEEASPLDTAEEAMLAVSMMGGVDGGWVGGGRWEVLDEKFAVSDCGWERCLVPSHVPSTGSRRMES
jgi:hypothetical protein